MTEVPVEREAKLAAPAEFEVPDLTGVVAGVRVAPVDERILTATYYDTDDLRLARAGVTVRYRSSGEQGEWTVKFPDDEGEPAGEASSRQEIEFAGNPEEMPAQVGALVAGHARRAPLVPVCRLETRRRRHALRDEGGARLGEIDDDEVTVLDGDGEAPAGFREIEVELTPDAPREVLDAVVKPLRAAGAGKHDPTPKLVRALGERAAAPRDLAPVELSRRPSAADVVRAGITDSTRRIIDHHHVVLLDADPEGVHQARVGTRRLRSDLRTFRPLLDQSWSEPLRDELKWLGGRLGAVRDLDVLGARLTSDIADLPEEDRAACEPLLARCREQREWVRGELLADMTSERYVALLDRLVEAAHEPRLLPDADAPAKKVLPGLVRRPWRKLRDDVRALADDPDDAALHRVRIRAKRARYAADVAAPVAGAAALRLAGRLAAVQDVLGEQHDAVVAEQWLRETAATMGPAEGVVTGLLVAAQRAESQRHRESWRSTWRAARRQRKPWSS